MDRSSTSRFRILALLGGLSLIASGAHAAGPSGSRLAISYEVFSPGLDHSGSLRIDSAAFGSGTSLDLEGDLGLESEIQAKRIAVDLQIGRRARFFGSLLKTERSGQASLRRAIQIGDLLFEAGVDSTSRLDFDETEVAVGYSLFNTEHGEFGFAVGAHLLSFDARVSGEARVLGPNVSTVEIFEEQQSEEVPIVTVGAYFRQDLTPGLTLAGEARVLIAEIEDYSADYRRVIVSLEQRISRRLSLGAGYFWQTIDLRDNAVARDSVGTLDFERTGTHAFLRLRL